MGSTIEIVDGHRPTKDHLLLDCQDETGDATVHKLHTVFWERPTAVDASGLLDYGLLNGNNRCLYAGSQGTVTKVLGNDDIQVRWDPEHMVDKICSRAALDFNEMSWESDNVSTIHFPPQGLNSLDYNRARWPRIKCIQKPSPKSSKSGKVRKTYSEAFLRASNWDDEDEEKQRYASAQEQKTSRDNPKR